MELILLFYCLNYFLVGVMVTVALIIAEWILFERAGQAGWKSLIPFYDSFIIHKIAFGKMRNGFGFCSSFQDTVSTYAMPSRKATVIRLVHLSRPFSSQPL